MATLGEQALPANPFEQFTHWYREAETAQMPESNAMTLATATRAGRPSARMVLLKGFGENGFVFYTNYESRKGGELAENPFAALVFHWPKLQRQVRIEGTVVKVSPEESRQYFQSRPLGSQISASISPQSKVVANREELERRYAAAETAAAGAALPLPPHWGGYRLIPELIEFWQARPNRLHDRLRYRREADGTWHIERLAP